MAKPKRKKRTEDWTERQLADWIIAHPTEWAEQQPHGPSDVNALLFFHCSKEFRSEEDMLAINRNGQLVIIELKNEKGDHHGIGQLLEYVVKFKGVTVDELEGLSSKLLKSKSLRQSFEDKFGKPLTVLHPDRIAILLAPGLRRSMHRFVINFLNAARGFDERIQWYAGTVEQEPHTSSSAPVFKRIDFSKTDDAVLARHARGVCARSRRKDRFIVLREGFLPVIWNLEQIQEGKTGLRPLSDKEFATCCLERLKKRVVIGLTEGSTKCSAVQATEDCNYSCRMDPSRSLRLIGRVNGMINAIELKDKRFRRFVRFDEGRLNSDWQTTDEKLPTWDEILDQKEASAKRST